ncbi:MAG TPA: DNA translocase FtsK 4TM domain-containing protein [Solirubrobacteraceae bacterium]|nr:DNA translocase FtsK 4TM domain-containing protein [Solirubrobacteraceae bacterium]
MNASLVPPTPNASNAVLALVLGVIGLVLCPICAPFAWSIGKRAENEVDAAGGALGGRGMATAGRIVGIIGTVLLAVYVLVVVVVVLLGAAISSEVTNLETGEP